MPLKVALQRLEMSQNSGPKRRDPESKNRIGVRRHGWRFVPGHSPQYNFLNNSTCMLAYKYAGQHFQGGWLLKIRHFFREDL